jgi:hypothetical protein
VAKQSSASASRTPSPSHSAGSHTRSASTTAGTDSLKSVPLIVLNNTTISGLAKQAAARFESGGWTVTKYDNYQNDILSTCAYYDPSNPQAESAARALQEQYPTIKRVKPRFAELPEGPVVVVLTPDYSPD